ncbi:MAG: hypothetical protein ACE368_07735 [Paracoccaceae bacterium]
MLDALSGKPNEKAVARSFEEFSRLRDVFNRLDAAAQASAESKVVPDFSRTLPTIEQVLALIAETRSDLRAKAHVAATESDLNCEQISPMADAQDETSGANVRVNLPEVKDQAHARQLLEVANKFTVITTEKVILSVTQSLMIGRMARAGSGILPRTGAGQRRSALGLRGLRWASTGCVA